MDHGYLDGSTISKQCNQNTKPWRDEHGSSPSNLKEKLQTP